MASLTWNMVFLMFFLGSGRACARWVAACMGAWVLNFLLFSDPPHMITTHNTQHVFLQISDPDP